MLSDKNKFTKILVCNIKIGIDIKISLTKNATNYLDKEKDITII